MGSHAEGHTGEDDDDDAYFGFEHGFGLIKWILLDAGTAREHPPGECFLPICRSDFTKFRSSIEVPTAQPDLPIYSNDYLLFVRLLLPKLRMCME